MGSFQSKNLSDEDIDRLLDVCANTELRRLREIEGMQIWHCPVCGLELSMDQLEGMRPMRVFHVRAEYVHAWIA